MAEAGRSSVLFIGLAAFGAHGGIQRFNRRVVDALAVSGRRASVLMLADAPGAAPRQGASAAVDVAGMAGSRVAFLRQFLTRLRDAEVLLVGHINLLPFAAIFRVLRPSAQTILFAHGVEIWGDPAYRKPRWWEPRALRFAIDRVAVVSAYSRDLMARAFGFPANRFTLFPNAVDLVPAPESKTAASPVILAVSRLGSTEREKHVDKLIGAMPAVLRNVPDARLVIIGEGALQRELQAMAERLGVADHVDFRGAVSDEELAGAYSDAAVFALPSSKEGFGIVFLEAWLRGLPVVASRFGAAAEVVDDGRDGFTVDPHDGDALAAAIVDFLGNPDRSRQFAAEGRAKVERLYSADAFRANLQGVLAP